MAPADALREHVFTADQFFGELTLVNQETGEKQVLGSERLTVDLAS